MQLATIADETRLALATLAERAAGIVAPSLRLGGPAWRRRAKPSSSPPSSTTSSMADGCRSSGLFSGRVTGADLEPQPTMTCRASTTNSMSAIRRCTDRPASTRRTSALRLSIQYESASFFNRSLGRGRLNLDIVDYPGEWLLDLPLLAGLFDLVARGDRLRPGSRPDRAGGALAGAGRDGACRRPRGRDRRPRAGSPLHRISPRLPGERPRRHRTAGPLPNAGRSRRLAGADLRAAGDAGAHAAGFAWRDDGPPLRRL